MKHYNLFLVAAATLLAASCSGSSDWSDSVTDGGTVSGGSSTGSSSVDAGEVKTFSINVDSTDLAESETIDADDEDYVENNTFSNTIYIKYNGTSATVSGDDNNLVSISGADVTVTPTLKSIYILSGTATDGSFRINSDDNAKKVEIQLNGVSITNNDGPAINVQSGKRTYIVANEGTYNHFIDGSTSYATSTEDQKGTIFSEGELLFSGKGHVNVSSTAKNGIVSDDYIMIRPNTNIYVKSTSGNGIKGKEALLVKGGVVNVEVSATASKGLSSDGNYQQDGGRVIAITSGTGEYDSDEKDVSACSGLKADSVITINGGTLECKSTGKGGKGISTDQSLTINDGTVDVITTGSTYSYSNSLDSKAKGIKADGNITINGGDVMVRAAGGSGCEGIESKKVLTISDGSVKVYAYDDGINSASHMYIKGGTIFSCGTNNDGLDANGNLWIQGGNVVAYGATSPEEGIDANTEGGYKLYITGGNVVGIGGGATTPSSTSGSQPTYIYSGTISSGSTVTLQDASSNTLLTFNMVGSYSSATFLFSTGMTSGSSYTLYNGTSSLKTFTATSPYSSSGSTGGMGGGFH